MDLLFDDTIDTSNITNVLLIDKDTLNYEIFNNSCNGITFPIVYSSSCSRNDLLQLLNNKFTKIDRLCFVFSFKSNYLFLNNELLFRNDETLPYSENVTFLIDLINIFNISTVDYLACETMIHENWQNYYNIILTNTTAIIGASSDLTGNLKYGGDWTMESTGEDIEAIYFTSNIQNYQNLLDNGGSNSLFIMNDGTVYGTGFNGNGYGQLGAGFDTPGTGGTFGLVQMINNTGKTPASISTGKFHTIVLMTDGTIYGVGDNTYGQLGIGPSSPSLSLQQMSNTTGKTPIKVSCGELFTIVFMSDGTIYGTGQNSEAQFGIPTGNIMTLQEVPNTTGKTPINVSTGYNHTMVLMSDGTIYGVGRNSSGQLGVSNPWETDTLGRSTLTKMYNGTDKTPVAISCGPTHTMVLMYDGSVYGTGSNFNGELILTPTDFGTIYRDHSTIIEIVNDTGKTPVRVVAGAQTTYVLMSDKTIYSAGLNNAGQLGRSGSVLRNGSLGLMTNDTGKTPAAIYCGNAHVMVLMTDGTVYGVGSNSYGELGLSSSVSSINTLTLMPNTTGKTPIAMNDQIASKQTPLLSNFSIPTKRYGDSPFTIVDPSSNSTGSFIYSLSNNFVATISGNTITIINPGPVTVTATQAETTTHSYGVITTPFQVLPTPLLSNFSIPTKSYIDQPFTIIPPTSNSNGSFSYSSSNTSVATVSGNTITIVGAGTVTITATQSYSGIYDYGTITTSFQVTKVNPSITSFSIPAKSYGDQPFTITQPTSDSDGLFTYSSSNTSVATISGNTITIVGAGTTTITASQAESTNYTSGTITASFQVNKANPSISGFSIPTKSYSDQPFTITQPTSNSSGSFSYSSSDTSVATISGNTITIVGAGTATITATQAETTAYINRTITTSFVVSKSTPSITGFSIPTKTYGDSPFTIVDPSSNSTGSFNYVSSNTSIATISGNTITIVGAGTLNIIAIQASTETYTSRIITTSFQVNQANQTNEFNQITPSLSNFSIPTKTFGNTPFAITPPTSNSSGQFTYISSDTSLATISGNTITILGAGTLTIIAIQQSTVNYTSGTITTSFQIAKATPSITGFSIPTKTFGNTPFTIVDPSSNSTGLFNYVSSNISIATISGNTITIVGAGTTTITASQEATTNYNSRTQTASFVVSKATPSISGFSIPTKTYGDSPFTIVDPSSNSTGLFNYVSSNTSIATISGNTITIIGAGTTTITASQEETTNYNSRTQTASFVVSKATPSITGFSIPTKTYGDSPFAITPPTSNSYVAFTYSSSNTSVATVSGNKITVVNAGTATITAYQLGKLHYESGTATASFVVNKATPLLGEFSIGTRNYGESDFIISPPKIINSNGSISYSSSNTSVAVIYLSNVMSIVGVGTTIITGFQEETSNYYMSGTISTPFVVLDPTPLLSNFSIPTKSYDNEPFTISPPTSNSNGSFSYSSSNTSVATVSGNTITIVGVGTVTITATQAQTTSYASGTITTSFQVNKTNPSITGFSIPTKSYSDQPFTITQPTSNSSGSFSYSSSDTSVATISGDTITIVGLGTTTITASQEASSNYNSGTQIATFQVEKITPSITGFLIPTRRYPPRRYGTTPFIITQPTSDSDGLFSYTSSNSSVATISENTIEIVGAGTATITAIQAETAFYKSGTLTSSIQVVKAIPSISSFIIQTKNLDDIPFTIPPPISNSDGIFSYVSSDTSVATISGNTITIVGLGISTIIATQAETSNYTSGEIITSFEVTKVIPSISNFSIPTKIYGDSPFTIPSPTSNSSGTFTYISGDTSIATVSGNTITIVGVGTATIIAVQAETSNYRSGTKTTSFEIDRADPSISGFSIPTKTYGDSPFTITKPTSNSIGAFTYISGDTSVATISGNTITIVGVGTSSIIAVQEKTSIYSSGVITTVLQVLSP
jgi:alpha-tubulin suppressor-like RCC1 family protein/uncharacterized protein YjdB